MAASPRYKIYRGEEYIASTKTVHDALLLIENSPSVEHEIYARVVVRNRRIFVGFPHELPRPMLDPEKFGRVVAMVMLRDPIIGSGAAR